MKQFYDPLCQFIRQLGISIGQLWIVPTKQRRFEPPCFALKTPVFLQYVARSHDVQLVGIIDPHCFAGTIEPVWWGKPEATTCTFFTVSKNYTCTIIKSRNKYGVLVFS